MGLGKNLDPERGRNLKSAYHPPPVNGTLKNLGKCGEIEEICEKYERIICGKYKGPYIDSGTWKTPEIRDFPLYKPIRIKIFLPI